MYAAYMQKEIQCICMKYNLSSVPECIIHAEMEDQIIPHEMQFLSSKITFFPFIKICPPTV